jgi:hypothetical protein
MKFREVLLRLHEDGVEVPSPGSTVDYVDGAA